LVIGVSSIDQCECGQGKAAGGSAVFPGSSDSYLEIANHGIANSNFTIEFWVQRHRASATGSDAILEQVGCGSEDIKFNWVLNNYLYSNSNNVVQWNSNSFVMFGNRSFSTFHYVNGGTPAAGLWAHLTFVFGDQDRRGAFYRDGVEQTVVAYSVDKASPIFIPVTCTQPLRVGTSLRFGGTSLLGLVDDLRIWHTARSPEQIAANYNTQFLSAPDLAVSLLFDQSDLGLDSSTNRNNAVMQGSVIAGPGSMCRGCAAGTFKSSV
jgi:hypothetical protein